MQAKARISSLGGCDSEDSEGSEADVGSRRRWSTLLREMGFGYWETGIWWLVPP